MERSLLKELNKTNLTAYVNRRKEQLLKTLYWQTFFQLKSTTTLDWQTLSGSSGAPVMADVIEYNASAPIKTRRTVRAASGDIPKTAVKRKMDEKDYNDYTIMKALAGGDADKAAILDIVFNDVDFTYTGVIARTEWLALQAISYGQLTLDQQNNNGKITEVAVDFGIPTANKTAVGVVWSNAATATPVKDIRDKVKEIEDNGDVVNYIVMDKATWAQAVATTELKDAYAFYQGISAGRIAVPGLDGVNAMLVAEGLPQIRLVNSTVRFENEDHVITTLKPWEPGHVAFLPDLNVGVVKHGPIAEENSAEVKKIATVTKVGHVLITKWADLEPFGEWTKATGNFFPTFADVDSIYLLKTNATAWS